MFNFFKKTVEIKSDIVVVREEDYHDIEPIADYFYHETGITFDKQISILKSKVISFCRKREILSFPDLLQGIKSDEMLKQELINLLTTNETFFYREVKQIFQLVEQVKQSHGHISILCAPCATGEESYSITIALLEAGVPASSFSIVGIDINSEAIAKAENAVYGERNIRNLSPEIVAKYFAKDGKHYALLHGVKSLVTFHKANIFDDSFKKLGTYDFVFSRNMLIYFDKETKLKAKAILESMRKDVTNEVFFGHADLF